MNQPKYTNQLLEHLAQKGFLLEQLGETTAFEVIKDNKSLIFIGDETPLTPQIAGIILSNEKTTRAVLNEASISVGSLVEEGEKVLLYIDDEGFFQALQMVKTSSPSLVTNRSLVRQINQYKNCTDQIHSSYYRYALRFLKLFTDLKACSIELVISDLSLPLTDAHFRFERANTSLTPHYVEQVYHPVTKQKIEGIERVFQMLELVFKS
jgi:hypothetical protein